MPRRDGRGPFGEGPLTGRKLGNCYTDRNNKNFLYYSWVTISSLIGICFILKKIGDLVKRD